MKAIKTVCVGIDTFTDWVGRKMAWMVFAVLAVIICEVVLRRFFGRPQIWTMDMITMLFGAYVILILGFGLLNKTFVCVDVLSQNMRPVTRHLCHVITSFVFLVPFIRYMVPRSTQYFLKSLSIMERGYSVWGPILWPFKLSFLLGLILLGVQAASEILKEIVWIIEYYKSGRREPDEIRSLSVFKNYLDRHPERGD